MSLEFEWDEDKAKKNLKKHGVSFEEASTVFGDPFAITIPDPVHSEEEDRFITPGESHRRRLLVVVCTDRGDNHSRFRLSWTGLEPATEAMTRNRSRKFGDRANEKRRSDCRDIRSQPGVSGFQGVCPNCSFSGGTPWPSRPTESTTTASSSTVSATAHVTASDFFLNGN